MQFDQKAFFKVIQELLHSNIRLAKWVEANLNTSTSGAYAKINGKRPIGIPELLALCGADARVGMWTAELFGKHNLKVVQLEQFRNEADFARYLDRMNRNFQTAMAHDNFRLRYVARDLPIFFFFSHPVLLRIKFKQWTGDQAKQLPLLEAPLIKAAEALYQRYLQMPTEELWHSDAFASQFRQLQRMCELDQITEADYQSAYSHLESLEKKQVVWKERRTKSEGGSLLLCEVDDLPMANGALMEFDKYAQVMGSVLNAHYYICENPSVIEHFRCQWKQYVQWAERPVLELLV